MIDKLNMHNCFNVRFAERSDATKLLELMRELAVFEEYIEDFRVTESDLIDYGLGCERDAKFRALVAQGVDKELLGYAVVYEIPFTYDMHPVLVMKELYVLKAYRAEGVGSALMQAVLDYADHRKCGQVKWTVVPWNESAKAFYRRFGGAPDSDWEPWFIKRESLNDG